MSKKPPHSARVVDMAAFNRLRGKAGARVIAKQLGIPVSSAQKLMAGNHWQQQPDRVRLFNELRGGHIEEKTGVPTSEDLAKFGGLFDAPTRHSPQVEKDVHHVMQAAGVRPEKAREVVRRITAVNGGEIQIPQRLDSGTFLQMMEEKLFRALLMLDDSVIAAAGPRDLSQMISMLTEKRNLLRGEPTSIVRSDQRGPLDKVLRLLLEEAKRRGVQIGASDDDADGDEHR